MRPLLIALIALGCAPLRQTTDISITCPGAWQARGVVTSPMHVLTAAHIATAPCPENDGVLLAGGVPVSVAATNGDAAVMSAGGESWSAWARAGHGLTVGDQVCASVGLPRSWRCAAVTEVYDTYVVAEGLRAGYGDSGAGAYANGWLVGIVSRLGTIIITWQEWGGLLDGQPRVCLDCRWP